MPWGNGTGPAGLGPMTGRGAGYCAGYSVPGYRNMLFGYGRFGGLSWGGAWARRFPTARGFRPGLGLGLRPRFFGLGRGRGGRGGRGRW